MEAKHLSVTVPVSAEIAESLKWMRWETESILSRGIFSNDPPLTEEEERTGWRSFTDSAGTTANYAVGWRAEKQRAEAEARKAAEMAACPYVACTCGHHEDGYY